MALQKSTYNEESTWEALIEMQRLRVSSRSNYPQGPFLLEFEVSLEAADLDLNDEVLVGEIPNVDIDYGIYLLDCGMKLTEVDTGVDAHVADLMAGANVLISGSTIGQAGGTQEMDDDTGFRWTDIQGLDLKMKTTTAPGTAAAGTLTVRLFLIVDRYKETGS